MEFMQKLQIFQTDEFDHKSGEVPLNEQYQKWLQEMESGNQRVNVLSAHSSGPGDHSRKVVTLTVVYELLTQS